MPENYPMNTRNSGEMSDQEALNILEGFMSTLTDNLGSLTGQIKSLVTTLTKQSELDRKVTADLSKNIKTMDSNFRGVGKDLNSFGKYLEKTNKDSDRTLSEMRRQKRNLSGSNRNIESLALDKDIKIIEGQKKQLNALYESVGAKKKELEHDKQMLDSARAAWESLQTQVELDGATNENLIKALSRQTDIVNNLNDKYNKSNDEVQKSLDGMQANIDRINKQTKELYEENEKAMQPLREVVAESQNAFRALGSQSSIISKYINREEGTQEEQFQKAIDQTAEALTHAINELSKKIQESSEEDREDLEKQRRILQDQLKATQKLSPALEKTAKLMGDLKGSLGKTIQNITKNLLSTVESKYLDAYLTGFQNVYQSIESTRGEISARLRMDQGEFSSLQEEISNLIEERGLTGSISAIDTNEALQQLVASGVTDERILKEFSIMQAKLKAEGSSLNLTNEEMLTRTLSQINKAVAGGTSFDDAMAEMSAMFEATAQAEIYAREKYGQDIALVNGAEDQIVNMVTNIDTSLGKSTEEMTKDIQEAIVNAMSLQAQGIDSTAFLSQVQALVNGDITQQSTLGQVMMMKGLMPEDFIGKSFGEAYDTILESYRYAFENKGENYIATLASTYGSSMDVGDIRRLVNSSGEITTTLSDSDYDAMSKIQTESNEALADATYLSATEAWMTKMENAATDEAIAAEKLYEGDKKYLAVVGGIYDGVKDIVDILTQYAFTGFSGGGFSAFGGTGAGGSTTYGDFLTGKSGTTAGALGKGAGVAVGVGIAGYSMYEHAKEADLFNDFSAENIGKFYEGYLTDSKSWAGMGTAVGSALGGPVAGAVMGALWGGASELGNAIGDDLADLVDKHFTHLDDGFTEAAEDLKDSASALQQSATDQYKEAESNYNQMNAILKKNDVQEQKKYLLSQDEFDKTEILQATDKEIQEMFLTNLKKQELEMNTARQSGKTAATVLNKSQAITNTKSILGDAFSEYAKSDKSWSGLTDRQRALKYLTEGGQSEFIGALGGNVAAAELFSSFMTPSDMSDDELKKALIGYGYKEDYLEKTKDRKTLEQLYESAALSQFSSTAGYGKVGEQVVSQLYYGTYKKNHDVYLDADKQFRSRWEAALNATPDAFKNDSVAVTSYYEMDHAYPEADFSDMKNVHLIEHFGYDSVDKYKFASGLTSVPFDSYPAYLHEGERVLTKEEAKAYNELSANAVEQLSSMSDISTYLNTVNGDTYEQVFNSEHLGTDKLNKSIETQTTTLERKLDMVINALNTLIVALRPTGRSVTSDANVMSMNSNITQLATAK